MDDMTRLSISPGLYWVGDPNSVLEELQEILESDNEDEDDD